MKKFFNPLILATALAATACTNTEDGVINDDPANKTAISFVGESRNTPVTRAGFGADTQIALHIRSTKDASNIKETRTLAKASADATLSEVSFSNIDAANTDYVRYWDDAYGRDANLSVFAIAVPSKTDATNGSETNNTLIDHLAGDATWKSGALSEEVTWVVSSDQSGANTIANEDLVYSNNIKDGGSNGVYEWDFNAETPAYTTTTSGGPMKFLYKDDTKKDGPGKFDQGHLIFNHALSRVTINLIKGDGFGDNSFEFATGTNVKIFKVPTTGTLNIETGKWSSTDETGISKMATTETATGATYSLKAQMLPGYKIGKTSTDNVLEFTIDNNVYYVTQAMMFAALDGKTGITLNSGTEITMEQGRNYVFNITVAKSKVNVTASVVDFTPVTATDQKMNNSHITVSLTENGAAASVNNYDWYRLNDGTNTISTTASSAKNWDGNYTTDNKATLTETSTGSGKWVTNWFFENNMSFYHFRAVNKKTEIKANDTDAADYFVIQSGAQANHDYQWGAPMINTTANTLTYSESNGYASEISPAIGATNDAIKLTMLHMMSNIEIDLKTTTGNDKVNLAGSKVYISNYYTDGTVLMGNGKVAVSGSVSTDLAGLTTGSTDATTGSFTYAVVPQALSRGTNDNIVITIETTDGNKYIINDLTTVLLKNSTTEHITEWLTGRSYTYTFTLKKTGIDNVTCSVAAWTNVEASDTEVKL